MKRSENQLGPSEQHLMVLWCCWAHAAGTAHLCVSHHGFWVCLAMLTAKLQLSYSFSPACDVFLSWAEKQGYTYLYMLHIFCHAPTLVHHSWPKLTRPSYPASSNLPPWRSFLADVQCCFTRAHHTLIIVGKFSCSSQTSLYVKHFWKSWLSLSRQISVFVPPQHWLSNTEEQQCGFGSSSGGSGTSPWPVLLHQSSQQSFGGFWRQHPRVLALPAHTVWKNGPAPPWQAEEKG